MNPLFELGYSPELEEFHKQYLERDQEIGRVVAVHRDRFTVSSLDGQIDAELTGRLRFTITSGEEYPAVGDWVALTVFSQESAVIHRVLPRKSVIYRQAVAHHGEVQVIAANLDVAFIVQAVDRDFNINRLERYLTLSNQSHVKPVILLTKTDLIDAETMKVQLAGIRQRIPDTPVILISNESREGYDHLVRAIEPGKTHCLLGSSGAGKSTILNNLSGRELMRTGSIGEGTRRGKHTTTRRELFILENGAIIIDNPGMREVGIADQGDGLIQTFDQIAQLAEGCRYPDCTHTTETGCAVIQALESGQLNRHSYENYLRMKREQDHFDSSALERRNKERAFGKLMKNYKKETARKGKW